MKRPNTCLECKYHAAIETVPYFYTIVCNHPERNNYILTGEYNYCPYYGCDAGEMKTEDEVEL